MKKVILLIIIISLTGCFNRTDENNIPNNGEKTGFENYEAMKEEMITYYTQFYVEYIKDNIDEEIEITTFKVILGDLEPAHYDISKFFNLDTKEQCDLKESYALIEQIKDSKEEYKVKVFYKCGEESNIPVIEDSVE